MQNASKISAQTFEIKQKMIVFFDLSVAIEPKSKQMFIHINVSVVWVYRR